ncbi:MAG: hypothetical protein HDR97_00395 [Bacteroides sp.]|nr:hypothetical protein [Bacteroides sp.]
MSCFLEEKEGTLIVVLTFNRDQLLYDIKNYAYIEGSVMETENDHNHHMTQDVGEEGNVDRITRVLDLSMAKCRELLYPYTKHEVIRPVLDNRLRERKVYGIVMSVPKDFSQTSLMLLERLIHEYLVCKAVEEWMSFTNPSKTHTWAEKAADAMREIRSNLNARIGRVRRKLHPF